MIRKGFEEELRELTLDLLRMGSLVEQAIADSVKSLKSKDIALAKQVLDGDDAIDELEVLIENKCLKLIATQQPLAGDLRRISTVFKIITDLERMGDHASDIAKVTIRIGGEPLIKPLVDIPRMAQLTQCMVRSSLDAFTKGDVELALSLNQKDDEVDHLYKQIFRELLTYMMESPRTIEQATSLLFVARYLERVADHATNIGERVVYLVTGKQQDLNI